MLTGYRQQHKTTPKIHKSPPFNTFICPVENLLTPRAVGRKVTRMNGWRLCICWIPFRIQCQKISIVFHSQWICRYAFFFSRQWGRIRARAPNIFTFFFDLAMNDCNKAIFGGNSSFFFSFIHFTFGWCFFFFLFFLSYSFVLFIQVGCNKIQEIWLMAIVFHGNG